MQNLYVITGAPCSGKSTLLDLLRKKKYRVTPEVARVLIDKELSLGKTIEEIRKDESIFQEKILDIKEKFEETLNQEDIFFLDRGIPDSYAYFKLLGISNPDLIKRSLRNNYKKVFILENCPFKKDYARIETEEDQKKLFVLLKEAYTKAGAEIVFVPVFDTKKERVDFVLKNL